MVSSAQANTDRHTLQQKLQQLRDGLRPGQQALADWTGGPLAVSAVPGAGKSTGMAIATAILLGRRYLQAMAGETVPGDQIVLVTFTRSAAANLRLKIRTELTRLGLPPTGFAVYTLHGLALNIANRHPDLSGLNSDRMTLVTPGQSHRLIRTSVEQWIASNPRLYQQLLEGLQFDGEETERLRRQSVLRTEVLPDLANTVIREAKSSGLLPPVLLRYSQEMDAVAIAEGQEVEGYNLLAIAAGLYEHYQTLLTKRNFIDYDDMILAALRVLDHESARQSWQSQVFAVFEDEAQDSSPLQTRLLELLATHPTTQQVNLVRVGDPNQAINSTFTPADPLFFREFCHRCAQQDRLAELDQAGRSSPIIIDAANFMLAWVNRRYRAPQLSNSEPNQPHAQPPQPFRPQLIRPVSADDPQPNANPQPEGHGVEIRYPRDIYHSVELMAQRAGELFRQNPEAQVAVLVRENKQGKFVADVLRDPVQHKLEVDLQSMGVTIYEVGERDRHSHIPAEILALLQFLDRPHSPEYLKGALRVLVDRKRVPTQDLDAISSQPEQFLYPIPIDPPQSESVAQARRYCNSLLNARIELPAYQLIPFLALTLQYTQSELATADKLSARVAQQTSAHQCMAAMLEVLGEIVRSERFEPVETESLDSRYTRPGQLTIITMHKAKGLDWDAVFIPFLQEQSIPGSTRILPQARFLGEFNPSEVARAQIRAIAHNNLPIPGVMNAWHQAGYLKLAEEYRLLYVAMTRAKRLLWMAAERKAPFSWNKIGNLDDKVPCPCLPALSQQFSLK
ncbi:ATP-dependent helicase [Leptolyngbya sp. AN02str]|uniref:ATP-dependent helicase n=1 Tax=Leptolyngbya sp. AN02str TaxID=3423363 RepID=UPI003D317862